MLQPLINLYRSQVGRGRRRPRQRRGKWEFAGYRERYVPRGRINLNSHYCREARCDTPYDPTPNTGNSGLLGRTALGFRFISSEPSLRVHRSQREQLVLALSRSSIRLPPLPAAALSRFTSLIRPFQFRTPFSVVFASVSASSDSASAGSSAPLKPRQIGFRGGTPVVGELLQHRLTEHARSFPFPVRLPCRGIFAIRRRDMYSFAGRRHQSARVYRSWQAYTAATVYKCVRGKTIEERSTRSVSVMSRFPYDSETQCI